MGNCKMWICISKAQWHRHLYDTWMEEGRKGECGRWKLAEGKMLLGKVDKRAEGLVKGKLGALAHREKAAEHAVDVVSDGQIANAIITTTSNNNSFRLLN